MHSYPPVVINPVILIAEDNQGFQDFERELLLREGFTVEVASNSTETIDKIHNLVGPTVVLLDRNFSDHLGNLVLGEHLLKELEEKARHPIVTFFFSGDVREESLIAAYNAGAYGYLIKGCSPGLIIAEVKRAVKFVQQIMGPNIDFPTGTLNRRAAFDRIIRELSRAERFNTDTACVMIDVDGLKKINDSYGHLVGDRVIKSVADSIKEHIRLTDLVCRYGGDEFLALLFNVNKESVQNFAGDVSATIKSKTVNIDDTFPEKGQLQVSASVGISLLESQMIKKAIDEALVENPPEGGLVSERREASEEVLSRLLRDLIESADESMYNEKRKGGDCRT